MSLNNSDTLHLLLTLTAIVAVAHAVGFLSVRLRQPRVAGEIIGGLLLGPTVLGWISPNLAHQIVAGRTPTTAVLGAIYQLGQLLLMYCAGAALRSQRRGGEARTISLIALIGNVLPFVAGAAFVLVLNPRGLMGSAGNRTAFLLVFSCGIAVTSIPVISRILADLGLLKTSFARVVLSVALIDDVVLYVILSVALGLVTSSHGDQFTVPSLLSIQPGSPTSDTYYVIVSVAIFGLPLALGRSFVERAGSFRLNLLGRSNALAFQVVFMMVMTCLALVLGISPIFGAFIAGILAGTLSSGGDGSKTVSIDAVRAQETIQSFSFGFFIPIYFAIVGLRLDLIRQFDPAFFVGFLVFACLVKAVSVYVGARLAGERKASVAQLGGGAQRTGWPGDRHGFGGARRPHHRREVLRRPRPVGAGYLDDGRNVARPSAPAGNVLRRDATPGGGCQRGARGERASYRDVDGVLAAAGHDP